MILDSPVHAGLTRAQRAALVLAAIATVTLAPAIAEPTGPSHAAPPTGGVVVHDPVRSDTGLVEGDTSADARAVEGDTSADARAVEGDTSADARAVEGDISRERNAAEREREVTARQRSAADELQRLRRREAALTLELERVRVEAERVRRTIGRGAAAGAAESDERRALEERLEVTAAEEAEAAGMARRSAVDRARTHDRLALTEAELAETLAREAERNPVDPHRIERLKALLDRARELHDAEGDEGDTLLELQREVERLEHGSRQY